MPLALAYNIPNFILEITNIEFNISGYYKTL